MAAEPPKVVCLNVGGHVYTTTLYTITQYPDSKLAGFFNGESQVPRDPKGNYFIDRDGALFKHVLNFLRTRKLILPDDFQDFEQLGIEATFYEIKPLEEAIQKARKSHQPTNPGPGNFFFYAHFKMADSYRDRLVTSKSSRVTQHYFR